MTRDLADFYLEVFGPPDAPVELDSPRYSAREFSEQASLVGEDRSPSPLRDDRSIVTYNSRGVGPNGESSN
jgi:hypothetical protein